MTSIDDLCTQLEATKVNYKDDQEWQSDGEEETWENFVDDDSAEEEADITNTLHFTGFDADIENTKIYELFPQKDEYTIFWVSDNSIKLVFFDKNTCAKRHIEYMKRITRDLGSVRFSSPEPKPFITKSLESGTFDTRPLKTDAVARRMIAGALGLRSLGTERQRRYDELLIKQELERRRLEREREEAKSAVWED